MDHCVEHSQFHMECAECRRIRDTEAAKAITATSVTTPPPEPEPEPERELEPEPEPEPVKSAPAKTHVAKKK